MKHVAKKEWMGCAIATAAMIGELSYEEVALRADMGAAGFSPVFHRGGWPNAIAAQLRHPREMLALLRAVTHTEWRFSPLGDPLQPVRDFSFRPWPAAVWIQDTALQPRYGQWIVLSEGTVNDPSRSRGYVANKYPQRAWLIGCLAEPLRPVQLDVVRSRRYLQRVRRRAVADGNIRAQRSVVPLRRNRHGVVIRRGIVVNGCYWIENLTPRGWEQDSGESCILPAEPFDYTLLGRYEQEQDRADSCIIADSDKPAPPAVPRLRRHLPGDGEPRVQCTKPVHAATEAARTRRVRWTIFPESVFGPRGLGSKAID